MRSEQGVWPRSDLAALVEIQRHDRETGPQLRLAALAGTYNTAAIRPPQVWKTVMRRSQSLANPGEHIVQPSVRRLPTLLTVDDVADLLRTSRKAIYAMVERGQLPGVVRLGRRVLIREDDLLQWLRQKSTPSLER